MKMVYFLGERPNKCDVNLTLFINYMLNYHLKGKSSPRCSCPMGLYDRAKTTMVVYFVLFFANFVGFFYQNLNLHIKFKIFEILTFFHLFKKNRVIAI